MRKGLFIVLEGGDCTGKTTHAKLLKEALEKQGRTVHMMRFPNREGPIGELINRFLRNEITITRSAAQYLFMAQMEDAQPIIQKYLDDGDIVIADRYVLSSICYPLTDEMMKTRIFELKAWNRFEDLMEPIIKADMTFFMDIPPSEVESRYDPNEIYENVEFQRLLHSIFVRYEEGLRKIKNGTLEEQHKTMMEQIDEQLRGKSSMIERETMP